MNLMSPDNLDIAERLLASQLGKRFCLECGKLLYGDSLSHTPIFMVCGCPVGTHASDLETIYSIHHLLSPSGSFIQWEPDIRWTR